jgi:hypothetical protein
VTLDQAGGRRFLLAVFAQCCNTALCAYGTLDGAAYALVTAATVGAYIAGNVKQRDIEAKAP